LPGVRASFSGLLQGICDHIFLDVKTDPTKILDDGSRFRNPTEPLREDDQAEGPQKLDAVLLCSSPAGQIVDHHFAAGAL
jgi:hypothetical protein